MVKEQNNPDTFSIPVSPPAFHSYLLAVVLVTHCQEGQNHEAAFVENTSRGLSCEEDLSPELLLMREYAGRWPCRGDTKQMCRAWRNREARGERGDKSQTWGLVVTPVCLCQEGEARHPEAEVRTSRVPPSIQLNCGARDQGLGFEAPLCADSKLVEVFGALI